MFDVIVNVNAGKGNAKAALALTKKMFDERKVEYRVHETKTLKEATELVKNLTTEGCNLVVLGGDGTFNGVLNAVVNFEKTTIGFVPCGSGNDYVRCTDIPTDTKEALERILEGKVGYTDFIEMGTKRCLNVAGGGMDTDTLTTYYKMKIKGKVGYYLSLLIVLAKLNFHKVRISIDGGEAAEKTVFMIGVANGKYIGGGMPISPNSDVNDGKLNVVIVNELKRSQVFTALKHFLQGGKHINDPYTEEYLCDSVKLEMLDECKVQADGEILDEKVLECKIMHDTLRIFVK